jgi:hypothetical protein
MYIQDMGIFCYPNCYHYYHFMITKKTPEKNEKIFKKTRF